MKRNNTIMLSTILVIIMLFSLFCIAGCTVKNGTLNQDQTTTQEGKEPIKTEIVVLKYLTPEHPNWPITDDTPILKIIEEKTGVKINYIAVPSANYTEKFNMTMASGELPDLMHNSISVINEYANKKVFIPIDDLKARLQIWIGYLLLK